MERHTPGSWEWKRWPAGFRVTVGTLAPGRHVALASVLPMDVKGERTANARLIAAAPDMLEALEEVLLHTRHATLSDDALDALDTAREAIAKAKGRAE